MKKILVIEEQAQTRSLFIKGLSARGFYTISAENGQVGIQRAQEQLPDIIICGIMMPDLDGYSVLTTLRQNPATAVIPFIVVTAKVARTHLRKAMELGADDYITKPCTLEELLKAIAAQLEKQTVLRQWYVAQSGQEPEPSSAGSRVPDMAVCDTATLVATSPSIPPSIFSTAPQLSKVFHFIEANYHQPITLGDVAQAVGYSPAYLTSLVRRQTGHTVQRWIIEHRMSAARSLLLETDQVVAQIAAKVGYHHTVHFFRQFRQFHGTTPQAWRSAHRKTNCS
ncbi:DNA-binding response regulator [Leptolyngbya sp. FACHB-261]|uniref:DNA-binding response regulator n=1 Tax=Leptolyngbya sp. FACHB-261 TaxID=2692806 RepID=UPI0028C40FDD|nr:DNA-binding response regulator [Leptolyngbya sp. FACHB-261]